MPRRIVIHNHLPVIDAFGEKSPNAMSEAELRAELSWMVREGYAQKSAYKSRAAALERALVKLQENDGGQSKNARDVAVDPKWIVELQLKGNKSGRSIRVTASSYEQASNAALAFVEKNYGPARVIKVTRQAGSSNDARDAELNYSAVMKGWMFRINGQNYGPYPSEAKAKQEMASKQSPVGDDVSDTDVKRQKIYQLYKSWVAGGQKPSEAIGELADNFGISEQQVKQIISSGGH